MVVTKPVFFVVASLVALTINAAPIEKRIAQVISDSTQQWVQACTAAGGADKCGTTSLNAFMTLLAGAGDCDQQNAADDMIDLAKTLKDDPKMIALAQVFAQQPRNSPNKLSVNYCQQQPRNLELQGLFQCQFQGVDTKTFTNNVKVGGPGTIPLGLNAPLDPPGSCKAHPQGGIADGSQLVATTQDPGLNSTPVSGSTSGASNAGSSSNSTDSSESGDSSGSTPSDDNGPASDSGDSSATSNANSSSPDDGSGAATATVTVTVTAGSAVPTDSTNAGSTGKSGDTTGSSNSGASPTGSSAPSGFKLKNGQDAQTLNAKFASLTASSSCNDGEQACVDKGFAQCVSGKFVTTQCAASTECFALPLVNSAGTSIACTTPSDASSRIQATGASGGVTGA